MVIAPIWGRCVLSCWVWSQCRSGDGLLKLFCRTSRSS